MRLPPVSRPPCRCAGWLPRVLHVLHEDRLPLHDPVGNHHDCLDAVPQCHWDLGRLYGGRVQPDCGRYAAALLVCRMPMCPLPSTELSACVPLCPCVAVCVLADQRARRTADQRAHHTDEVCGRRSGGRCVCLVGLPQKTERRDGVLLDPTPQALVRKRSTSGLSSRTMRIISSKSSPLTDLPCTLSSCIPASSAHSRSA